MLHEAVNLSLSLLVFASGIACIHADMTGRRSAVYVFKPLTMLFVLSLALQSSASTSTLYAWMIVVGLLFSLAGDILLMLPSDRFAAGLASFLVAHVLSPHSPRMLASVRPRSHCCPSCSAALRSMHCCGPTSGDSRFRCSCTCSSSP